MHTAKTIAKNSLFYTAALIIQKLISTVYFWYYSNHLNAGATDLGRLQFAISFVTLFFILSDLGLYLVYVREASKKPENANAYLNTLLVLKIPLIALTSVIIIVAGFLYHAADFTLLFLALIWLTLDNITALFYGALRAHQNLKYESIAVVIYQIVVTIIGVIGVTVFGEPKIVIISLVIGTFLNLLYALWTTTTKLKFKIRLAYDKQIARAIIAYLPGFAVTGIVIKILNSLDVVLIKSIGANYETVALY